MEDPLPTESDAVFKDALLRLYDLKEEHDPGDDASAEVMDEFSTRLLNEAGVPATPEVKDNLIRTAFVLLELYEEEGHPPVYPVVMGILVGWAAAQRHFLADR